MHRSASLGLGLSIKGGSEHSLPILISRIVSESPADQSRQLFIGDEIIAVNGVDLNSNTTHDEALQLLRQSGDDITIRVRHHKAAHILRKWWRRDGNELIDIEKDNPLIKKSSNQENSKPIESTKCDSKVSNSWKECVRMELFLSNVSQYVCYSDKLRDAGFEIRAINGQSVVVQCDNEDICHQWCQTIISSINNLTDNHVINY